MLTKNQVIQPDRPIKVIAEADVAVIGGSFAGLSSAIRFAQSGKTVIILEPRTYLGREITATLRPWIPMANESHAGQRLEWLERCLKECMEHDLGGFQSHDVPLHPDRLKIALEDIILANGIKLLYATLPIGLQVEERVVKGVIIANKAGRQAVRCSIVMDATETGIMSSLTGASVSFRKKEGIYYRVLEFDGVEPIYGREMAVPSSLGLAEDQVIVRRGIRGESHVYVEFSLLLNAGNTHDADRQRELEGRIKGMLLASHLIHHIPAFAKANLGASSYELYGPFSHTGNKDDRSANHTLTANANDLRTAASNVWCLYRHMFSIGDESWLNAIDASRLGDEAARLALYDDKVQDEEKMIDPKTTFPLLTTVDVLVVGGGSCGASASIVAAQEGMYTMLIEGNPGMGGTGTFGGVDSYWFGRRIGYAARITGLVNNVQQSLRYKGHKWNIEAKMFALLDEAVKSGVHTLFNAITFDAITDRNQVNGCLVATRWGAYTVLAKVLIDATGDGDIAAYAGADYVYGSKSDRTVMWYSLAQFREPGKSKNNFTSMVNMEDIEDLTRAIVAGRRRGDNCHDHSIYVATRESRHIAGDVTMSLADQLLHRLWDDVINIHFSNHDVKGVSGADWVNVGLIPPNLEIEIPFRMLLPSGLEGLLVVGKAMSATHDALPAIRMQSDLENLGGCAALAAANAVKFGTTPRHIDIRLLQRRLVEEGLLPGKVLHRTLQPRVYHHDQLIELVDRIEEQPLYEYANMRMNEVFTEPIAFVEICTAGPRIIPILESALSKATGNRKIRIAQALAMYESNSGVEVLIDSITQALQDGVLPKRTADIMYVQLPPDHGAMPDTGYLLYSLAQTKDRRSIPVWQRVADLVQPTEDDFKDSLLGLYYYIDAVCKGAERLGDPNAAPVLLKLHAVSYLHDQMSFESFQSDYFPERRAMLELAIGRALASCGHPQGHEILIRYLDDTRSLLKNQSYLALTRLTGETIPMDRPQWKDWLERNKAEIRPSPQQLRLDVEWNSESILRVEKY
jgi:ribulose 1,5-bisphosphate synthetase/thiazole synthase